jgi:hypothetical protein
MNSNQQSNSRWWNGYNGQDIIHSNEFHTSIEWNDLVNILNETSDPLEKYKNFEFNHILIDPFGNKKN